MTASEQRTRVLFVCTGNICRSPLAEGVFLHLARQRDVAHRFEVDSAGTGGWHEGELADARMRAVAERHGVLLASRARPVRDRDLQHFDLLVAMDESHREWLLERGTDPQRVRLLLEFAVDAPRREVPDPYYGDDEGFAQVFALVERGCAAMLDHLLAERRTP